MTIEQLAELAELTGDNIKSLIYENQINIVRDANLAIENEDLKFNLSFFLKIDFSKKLASVGICWSTKNQQSYLHTLPQPEQLKLL